MPAAPIEIPLSKDALPILVRSLAARLIPESEISIPLVKDAPEALINPLEPFSSVKVTPLGPTTVSKPPEPFNVNCPGLVSLPKTT